MKEFSKLILLLALSCLGLWHGIAGLAANEDAKWAAAEIVLGVVLFAFFVLAILYTFVERIETAIKKKKEGEQDEPTTK